MTFLLFVCLFVMARSIPSDVLAGQPDILFEDTTTDFRHSPLQIKRKGCLHSSWAQFSLAVYILEAAEEGFYHKTHLERVSLIFGLLIYTG